MGLLTPIWMSKNLYRSSDRKLERAIARVSKLEDEELIKAATIAPCPDIRYAALKRLNDQTVLAEIAHEDKSFDVVLAAIKSLERIKSLEENIDIALVERIIGFLRNGNELDKSRAVTVLKKIYCDVQSPKEVKRYIRAHQGNYKYDSHSDSGCYMHEDHFEPFIHFDVQ